MDNSREKTQALIDYLELQAEIEGDFIEVFPGDIEQVYLSIYSYGTKNYYVGTEKENYLLYRNRLYDRRIREMVTKEIPAHLRHYFDKEKYKKYMASQEVERFPIINGVIYYVCEI